MPKTTKPKSKVTKPKPKLTRPKPKLTKPKPKRRRPKPRPAKPKPKPKIVKKTNALNFFAPRLPDYEDAFDLTGHGCLNRLALVACSLIFVYCSQEMTGIAYVMPPAECDIDMNVQQKSLANSGIFIGVVMSAICWGTISDHFGRRKVMLPALIASMLTSFASSLSTGFLALFCLRMLTGIFVSASSATVLVYLSELTCKKYRDRALAIAITMDQVNFVLFPGIAWFIIPAKWTIAIGSYLIRPWRVFMWTWSVTGVIGTLMLFKLPESPRFLLASKGSPETILVLARIYASNMGKKPSEYPVKGIKIETKSSTSLNEGHCKKFFVELSYLVRPPLRRCFVITHFCMLMVNMLTNGLYIWMPALINETLKDLSLKGSICDLIYVKYMQTSDMLFHVGVFSSHVPHDFDSEITPKSDAQCKQVPVVALTYILAILMELFYLLPYLLVLVLISKFTPNTLYGALMTMCAVALAICSVFPNILVATSFITVGLCSGSAAGLLSALAVDAFPTKLRALAMCTMFMVGQLGTIIGICVVSFMNGIVCQIIMFTIVSCIMASVLFLSCLWPDINTVQQKMKTLKFSY